MEEEWEEALIVKVPKHRLQRCARLQELDEEVLGVHLRCHANTGYHPSDVREVRQGCQADTPNVGKGTTQRDEAKQARHVSTNNLAIATVYYADLENRFKQAMLRDIAMPIYKWHTVQNKKLRSTEEHLNSR